MEKKTYKNFKGGLKINPEYLELIPPMSNRDFDQLKENIESDGVIFNPLTVDEDGAILDGHSRYKIAEMLDMAFNVFVKKVGSIEEGQLWIITSQLGRRRLSDEECLALEERCKKKIVELLPLP